ncbi:MAG: UDP-N-acetylglucosamine--N-acetylmuramyl-(pentapeptide) pyrophosphoryl-undecaprenol N-acetylglucosamine transferase [Actinobacteria bacterium]|nr:UDP-N-acetylglucosamine--N-acetylmuramyl-(pentapeptide) pyrophosphoryl-undecaprenol N-acetylglucosamine transferase [Actinomycetota bacterium]
MRKVFFAGGGTAGHVEPALAVAREWKSKNPQDKILFFGTSSGLENRLVPEAGFQLCLITKVRISRSLSPSLLLTPFSLITSIRQCFTALAGADILVGFGGYVSGPAYIAAALRRIPLVIHEANARPGIANRLGAVFTKYLATSYPVSSGRLSQALISGLPLKENIVDAFQSAENNWSAARKSAKSSIGFSEDLPLLFVFGGSQGSVAINSVLEESKASLKSKEIQVFHSVGAKNPLAQSDSYYKSTHYISDMASAYIAADVIISRSGAVTCAEINSLGRYALFIPLPVGNGEQELNALSLVDQGRAEVISQKEFTGEWLEANISRLLELSKNAPIEGSAQDINAASKIASLMEFALTGGK